MKTIHTPGPWMNDYAVEIRAGEFKSICGMRHPFESAENMANARLIAASPTMLAVLQELEESAGYWSEYDVPLGIVDRIRQVIKDATGAPQ